MEKTITFMGQQAKIGCDEKCHKAWGRNSRPTKGDYYILDDDLGIAPEDPGTYEGDDAKPPGRDNILGLLNNYKRFRNKCLTPTTQ